MSIAHRITGVLLFLLLPLPIYLWQRSLENAPGYQQVQLWLEATPLRLLLLLLAWWCFHHVVSGVRVLLIDFDRGVSLRAARLSAAAILVTDLLFLLVGAWYL